MSDTGRSAVYEGEFRLRWLFEQEHESEGHLAVELAGSTLTLPVERRFGDLASVQCYCDKIVALPQFAHAGPVSVRERRGNAAAHYSHSAREIAVCTTKGDRWAMRETVILHELAHHLAPAGAGHDLAWRRTYLALLTDCIGPEVSLALQVFWHGEGVPLA